jgi:hypothetical protein
MELIRTIAAIVSALGVLVAALAIWIALRQLGVATGSLKIASENFRLSTNVWHSYHERARKEKAISILLDYIRSDNSRWSATSRLVEKLNDDQIRFLDKGEPFSLEVEHLDLLHAAIPSAIPTSKPRSVGEGKKNAGAALKGEFVLNRRQSYLLRYETLSYLNAVELVCMAWLKDVADQTTIEEEMSFLYDNEQETTLMEKFRKKTGGERYYPAIHAFIDRLQKSRIKNIAPRIDEK